MEILYAIAIIFVAIGVMMWLFVVPVYFQRIMTALEKIAEKQGRCK